MTILSARISASLIVAPGSCRPRARPEQPQGWGPRFQRPEEGQSASCSERTGAPASRVAGVALEPARATFLQPSSLPFAAGCGLVGGRRRQVTQGRHVAHMWVQSVSVPAQA